MSNSNFHRLNDLLAHSCNRVLRALLAAVIKRERPSGARTVDELIQRDQRNIATKRIVQQNTHLVFTWNKIVIVERWDLQLLCFFIRYVCPPNDGINTDIDTLKEIRNKICHTADGLIDDSYYRVKCDEIKLINSRFLAIIGNAAFTKAVKEEIVEIEKGTRTIPEAADTFRDWLCRDKLQRTPITNFSDEQQELLDRFRRPNGRNELHVPDVEVDIVVEHADNQHQQDQVSETLVNILDPRLRSDPQLCNLTEAQFTAIKERADEWLGYLLEPRQRVVRATHGCVIITVRSKTFRSLRRLLRKLVSVETKVIMAPLQEILRKTFSERLTIKAVLPECGFLDVAEKLVQQIKDIDLDGSKEGPEIRAQIPEIEKGMEKLGVKEDLLADSISVIKLKIQPRSMNDYERLQHELSKDKMETTFERITDVLQQELNAPKLIISANLHSSGFSAIPNETNLAFSCFNGTRYQLIREDVKNLMNEAIVIETTESFDFKRSDMGKTLLEAGGEQIVEQCREKYPGGLQAGEIATIEGQKLLGSTLILLTCLPEYSEGMIHIMKQTFHKCLLTAVHHKMHSIAFTADGTSNAKYPVDVVASALVETCISFDKERHLCSPQDIAFVVPPADESGYLAFKEELQRPGIFELRPSDSKVRPFPQVRKGLRETLIESGKSKRDKVQAKFSVTSRVSGANVTSQRASDDRSVTSTINTDQAAGERYNANVLGLTVISNRALDVKSGWITGSTFLESGELVLCDHANSKLLLFRPDLTLKDELHISGQPWDVAAITERQVVVTIPGKDRLDYVDLMPTMKVTNTTTLKSGMYGIVSRSQLYVLVNDGPGGHHEVLVVRHDGRLVRTINLSTVGIKWPFYIEVNRHENRLYVSDSGLETSSVTCLDCQSGSLLFKYNSDTLQDPHGLYIDDDNHLLVCGWESHNITMVTADGHHEQILLSDTDGLKRPQTVTYRPRDGTLAVGMSGDGTSPVCRVFHLGSMLIKQRTRTQESELSFLFTQTVN